MAWTITGNSSDVLVGVSANGNAIIRGDCPHIPYIIDDWVNSEYPAIVKALRRLQTVNADWRILSTDAVQSEIIDNAALLKTIDAKSGKSIAQISCIDRMSDSEPVLSFTIAIQPQSFQQVYELFSNLIVGFCEIEYTISVGFLTFRSPTANADIPTLDEFRSGRPYFSDEISVSVRRVQQKGA